VHVKERVFQVFEQTKIVVLQYVNRQEVTAILPKKLAKSLIYMKILCSMIVQLLFLKNAALIQEIPLTIKANFATKNAKMLNLNSILHPSFDKKNIQH
jgi:hypothetical protein